MSRLFIQTVRLIGIRKNYEVVFKQGLNYISGPTSTGKTSILEMINYALGAKKHKAYIEIGEACTHVELEIRISGEQYKMVRKLFDFTAPVRVDIWDEKEQKYQYLDILEIDSPSNEKSLSYFFISRLGLGDVKISNQYLSFRDIFKYSYLKQTEIDTEDLMGELIWIKNIKRKNTFEIIFNIYDEMTAALNSTLKEKMREMSDFRMQLEGISNFIDATEIGNISTYRSLKNKLDGQIAELKKELICVKEDKVEDNEATSRLRNNVVQLKRELTVLMEKKGDQEAYVERLKQLLAQYQRDIDKGKMLLVGVPEINKYEFVVCPNCLKPLKEHEGGRCAICNSKMIDDISELLQTKKEIVLLKRRYTELEKHILVEQKKKDEMEKEIDKKRKRLREDTIELEHLQEGYVNPYIEKIELLNYEMGKYNRQVEEMDKLLQMLEEYERLRNILKSKEEEVLKIKDDIRSLQEEQNDKQEILSEVSAVFSCYLKKFKFPKLSNAYIDQGNYLPHVRGRKYNDLGSLGGVTLIILAYYLAILNVTLDTEKFYHLNLLMIDSPRKNLGSDATQEEFRDEEIFNSIIRTFIELDSEFGEQMQLIVVNNGYPDFLPEEAIRAEFDTYERIGLIDDATV